ncbi:MAG: hypothetical protein PQJ47_08050 [Sphaerochaetaceae bacterium]|nr:hypothetical protein [Sphaerochaetaceae bacterium]
MNLQCSLTYYRNTIVACKERCRQWIVLLTSYDILSVSQVG